MNSFIKIIKDFPLLNNHELIFFDNASTTQKPQAVIDALVNFYTHANANVYRGIYPLAEHATQLYEDARATVAAFIGAQPHEIVFTSGTTESINFVAATWAETHLKEGDEIVISELEHHANLLVWQQLALKKHLVLKYIPIDVSGELDFSSIDTIITHKTKLVSVIHISNAIGTHVDIEYIIKKAHAVGARVLIDAAQSVAHQKIDIKLLQCDFLAFSGHKVLGPTGIGVLFIKNELHDQVPPYRFGGLMVENAGFFNATFKKAPYKFQAGTPPIAQAIGLKAALDYYQTHINYHQLAEHESALCARLIDSLCHMPEVRIVGSTGQLKKNGHLVSFVVNEIHAHDVAAFVSQYGIAVRAGHHCAQPFAHKLGYNASVRVSFFAYNTHESVDYFVSILKKLLKSKSHFF